MRFLLEPGAFAYLRDEQPPQIDPEVLPQHDWNVRNLGWFPPSRFIGGGPTVPTVTQRTANETAEVVQFIQEHYREQPNPQEEEANTVEGEPTETSSTEQTRFLDQGWTPNEREEFYYLTQGSQLLPYLWFLSLEQAENNDLLRADSFLASLGCIPQSPTHPRNPDGLPIGFVRNSNQVPIQEKMGLLGANFDVDQYPKTSEWLGFTCAACHTSEIVFQGNRVRIDGGAAMFDLESFLQELAESMRATVTDEEKFVRFEKNVRRNTAGDIDTTGLREELDAYTSVIERLVARNQAEHPYGLARLDAFGAILNQICAAALQIPENQRPSNAPVSYPCLWDTPHLDWVQWNSSVEIPVARNVGEVLGVFAHIQLTGTPAEGQFSSSANPQNLHRLEVQLRRLRAPRWPEGLLGKIDQSKAALGKKLFAENCAKCHNMRDEAGNFKMTEPNEFGHSFIRTKSVPFQKIGTDPQMVVNFISRTALPGDLASLVRPQLQTPRGMAKLIRIERTIVALGRPRPDFSKEVPATMLLSEAVSGVLDRSLKPQLRNRTEHERREIMLDLWGHRTGLEPPHSGAGYKARPLNGIWATAPYGHAGSVPNLYQWLLPQEERAKRFFISDREFDTKHVGFDTQEVPGAFEFRTVDGDGKPIAGNSNQGHSGPGQTDFEEEERWQLVEYLKTLD